MTTTTALTTIPSADDLLAILPTNADGTPAYDGYSDQVPADRIKLPRLIFNKAGVDKAGNRFGVDDFYNTVTELSARTVDCIFAHVRRTRAWTSYDETDESTTYHCASSDCVTGTLESTGVERPCRKCPDAEWRKDDRGKRTVHCNEIYSVLAQDLTTGEPFMVTFRKTSEAPWISHISKYHANRLRVPGRPVANVPLYAYHLQLGLMLQPNGKYALPTITVTGTSTRVEAQSCLDAAAHMREVFSAAAVAADPDTSFDPNEFEK